MNAHFKANEMFFSNSDLEPAMFDGFSRPQVVMGPLGELLALESLPLPSCNRWTPRRKAEVVAAVNGGLLTMVEACARYSLSLEEYVGWQRAADRSGIQGLRITRAQYWHKKYEKNQ